jgi:hypothetical protein
MRTRDREQVPSSSAASRRRSAQLIGAALLAAWVAVPVGCGDDQVCTPGAQVSCACGGGEEGSQACNSDGTALGSCDCSDATGPGSGGAGPAGPGSSSTGPGSGGAGPAGPGSGGSGAASSGGAGVCDGKGVCEDSDDDNSNDCVGCALDGSCGAAAETCGASQDCAAYIICLNGCGQTPTCVTECNGSEPAGKAAFDELAGCVCGQCPNDCAGTYFCQ